LIARKRIDVARRLFKMFDKDENGYLTEGEIPLIIQETYREMGQNYQPSREDVRSYMKMVDTDGDGKITLTEFEEIILRSLKNAGFEVY
jgi:Ca2+-binding EF-hand superfamily protein